MNALKKLENVKPHKPYHGFGKLQNGVHKIECFRVVKNKFSKKGEGSSKSILIELEEQVLFLPQYFWDKINENDIRDLNSGIDSNQYVYLFFEGKNEETK